MNNVSSLANVFNRSPSTVNDPVSYRGGTIRNNYYGRDIMSSIISRIALDASMCDFKHFKVNPENGNQIPMTSTMLDLMTIQANIDQTGRAFLYDLVWSMLDEGYIAVVPTLKTNGEIRALRVGKVDNTFTRSVRVSCLNDNTGIVESVVLPKEDVVLIESPFYTTLNRQNFNLRLLEDKIRAMQATDAKNLNNNIRGAVKMAHAIGGSYNEKQNSLRRTELINDIQNDKLGFMFLHPNEELIKFDGKLDDSLLDDVERLRLNLYEDFGITADVMSGKADQFQVNVYYRRTIDPVLQAITDAFNSKFLTKTARTQGQRYGFYRDIFRLVPPDQLSSIADVLGRNGYYAPNEIRNKLGDAPHPDPIADQIFNRNIADANQQGGIATAGQSDVNGDGVVDSQDAEYVTVYDNGDGTYSDENGNPVDENGNPI